MLTSSARSTLPAVQNRAREEAGNSYCIKLVQNNVVHIYTQANQVVSVFHLNEDLVLPSLCSAPKLPKGIALHFIFKTSQGTSCFHVNHWQMDEAADCQRLPSKVKGSSCAFAHPLHQVSGSSFAFSQQALVFQLCKLATWSSSDSFSAFTWWASILLRIQLLSTIFLQWHSDFASAYHCIWTCCSFCRVATYLSHSLPADISGLEYSTRHRLPSPPIPWLLYISCQKTEDSE